MRFEMRVVDVCMVVRGLCLHGCAWGYARNSNNNNNPVL